jgi:hypothetical protein
MKTVIEMAREAGIRDCTCGGSWRCLERFAELVRAEQRNATLDEIATKIEQDFKGAFGVDTCASWAAWIRNQKCEK